MAGVKASERTQKRQMRMIAAIVTCPIISAWMPQGKSCKVSDIIEPEFVQPTTAAGIRAYMEQHVAKLEGRD